ncbi:MAG TPA: DUF1801 domain-containing protein [Kofleriaceae bacterium]|nr:DUF1801 domain-containing protein [Kofleriaceae bacterium]
MKRTAARKAQKPSTRSRPRATSGSSKPARTTKAAKPAASRAAARTHASRSEATKRPAPPRAARSVAPAPRAGSAPAPAPRAGSAPAPAPRAGRKPGPRVDYGRPIAGFFARQAAPLRAILEALRALIEETAPDASSSLKWGMPFFMIGDTMMCALAGHKAHVNLILSGPPGTYADPEGRLAGDGKTGRHLKLTRLEDLPHDAVRGWLRTAAELARKQAS